jgi:hypothetical protein
VQALGNALLEDETAEIQAFTTAFLLYQATGT